MTSDSFGHSVRRIVPLAWPVFVGQGGGAGGAFGTIDTVLVARHSIADLAALAVGMAIYITVFVGLMGVVLAVSPIVGQLYGAKRLAEAGHQLHQSVWLAIGLSFLGSSLLAFPEPFLALARANPDVAHKVRGYLLTLAFSLPAALLFTVFRGFNTAVSRPKAVMALQVAGLGLKVPLSDGPGRWPARHRPAGAGRHGLRHRHLGVHVVAGPGRHAAAATRPVLSALPTRQPAPPAAAAPRLVGGLAEAGRAHWRLGADRGDGLLLHGHLHRTPGRHNRWPVTRSPSTWCRCCS